MAEEPRMTVADVVAGVLAREHARNDIRNRHPWLFGHRGAPVSYTHLTLPTTPYV